MLFTLLKDQWVEAATSIEDQVVSMGPLLLTMISNDNTGFRVLTSIYIKKLCDEITHPCPNYNDSLTKPPSKLMHTLLITSQGNYVM